jgi:hypothetical protein
MRGIDDDMVDHDEVGSVSEFEDGHWMDTAWLDSKHPRETCRLCKSFGVFSSRAAGFVQQPVTRKIGNTSAPNHRLDD